MGREYNRVREYGGDMRSNPFRDIYIVLKSRSHQIPIGLHIHRPCAQIRTTSEDGLGRIGKMVVPKEMDTPWGTQDESRRSTLPGDAEYPFMGCASHKLRIPLWGFLQRSEGTPSRCRLRLRSGVFDHMRAGCGAERPTGSKPPSSTDPFQLSRDKPRRRRRRWWPAPSPTSCRTG